MKLKNKFYFKYNINVEIFYSYKFLIMKSKQQSFYDISNFPQLDILCQNWKIIRDEYKQLNLSIMNVDRVNKAHEEVYEEVFDQVVNKGENYGWIKGWGEGDKSNSDWLQYGLIFKDQKVPFIGSSMSKTIELLQEVDGLVVAAFLKLKPRSVLHTHNHPDLIVKQALQLHLPIETATHNNFNYINVNGNFRQYECGKPIVFDGTLDHFALNESNLERITLYLEFKNYFLK